MISASINARQRLAHRYHAVSRRRGGRRCSGIDWLTHPIEKWITAVPDIVKSGPFTFYPKQHPQPIATTQCGHARRIHRAPRRLMVGGGAALIATPGIATWRRTTLAPRCSNQVAPRRTQSSRNASGAVATRRFAVAASPYRLPRWCGNATPDFTEVVPRRGKVLTTHRAAGQAQSSNSPRVTTSLWTASNALLAGFSRAPRWVATPARHQLKDASVSGSNVSRDHHHTVALLAGDCSHLLHLDEVQCASVGSARITGPA